MATRKIPNSEYRYRRAANGNIAIHDADDAYMGAVTPMTVSPTNSYRYRQAWGERKKFDSLAQAALYFATPKED